MAGISVSVGDIFDCIKTIQVLIEALNGANGASKQYEDSTRFLTNVRKILERLLGDDSQTLVQKVRAAGLEGHYRS
jgi:hypothetical protein